METTQMQPQFAFKLEHTVWFMFSPLYLSFILALSIPINLLQRPKYLQTRNVYSQLLCAANCTSSLDRTDSQPLMLHTATNRTRRPPPMLRKVFARYNRMRCGWRARTDVVSFHLVCLGVCV